MMKGELNMTRVQYDYIMTGKTIMDDVKMFRMSKGILFVKKYKNVELVDNDLIKLTEDGDTVGFVTMSNIKSIWFN